MRLRLRFDPQAPILLGTGRDLQQVRESLEVIPGSAVLGALARPLLASAGIYRTHPMVPGRPVPLPSCSGCCLSCKSVHCIPCRSKH